MLNRETLCKMDQEQFEDTKRAVEEAVDEAVEALHLVNRYIEEFGSGSARAYLGASISIMIKEGRYMSRDQTLYDLKDAFATIAEEEFSAEERIK